MIDLKPLDVSKSTLYVNSNDLRRDLHAYMMYVDSHEVKRHFRSNDIPKSDAKRIAASMTDSSGYAEFAEGDKTWPWLDYVDRLALALGFVSYDIKGVYRGYSSSEPSFIDNYIEVKQDAWRKFLDTSLQEQEDLLLKRQVERSSYNHNEFIERSPLGSLDTFQSYGCACGVLPTITFGSSRQFLLGILKDIQPGQWWSVASVVALVKEKDPYFLIPRDFRTKNSSGEDGRYQNFGEATKEWDRGSPVPATASNGFERVEGRYIERFLENIPLTMGYVELAYDPAMHQTVYPSIGLLKGFRTTTRYHRFAHEGYSNPKVTVLPNFEAHVQSDAYPASLIERLLPIAVLERSDASLLFRLDRTRIVNAVAAIDTLDVLGALRSMTGGNLPANVEREIEGWCGKGEVFVLYDGCSLLEAEESCPDAQTHILERISPRLSIVGSSAGLDKKLDQAGFAPLVVSHDGNRLKRLPEHAKTVFGKAVGKASRPEKRTITLFRSAHIRISVPDADVLEDFALELATAGCPAYVDRKRREIAYDETFQRAVDAALLSLRKRFEIRVAGVEGVNQAHSL
jgi:hypothetical protein